MRLTFLRLPGSRGYTIDQTILIVAIIAILITLVIVTVAWTLIGRTSSTKLTAQLKQIEGASGEFFATYGEWPQNSYTGTQNNVLSALALTGGGVTYKQSVLDRGGGAVKNLLSGAVVRNGAVRHSFNSHEYSAATNDGPGVYLEEDSNPIGLNPGRYLVVLMDDVPLSEVREADKVIDGTVDFSSGKLVAGLTQSGCHLGGATNINPSAKDSQLLDICYVANQLY
jgi:Tfp pilus assembly protein PilE